MKKLLLFLLLGVSLVTTSNAMKRARVEDAEEISAAKRLHTDKHPEDATPVNDDAVPVNQGLPIQTPAPTFNLACTYDGKQCKNAPYQSLMLSSVFKNILENVIVYKPGKMVYTITVRDGISNKTMQLILNYMVKIANYIHQNQGYDLSEDNVVDAFIGMIDPNEISPAVIKAAQLIDFKILVLAGKKIAEAESLKSQLLYTRIACQNRAAAGYNPAVNTPALHYANVAQSSQKQACHPTFNVSQHQASNCSNVIVVNQENNAQTNTESIIILGAASQRSNKKEVLKCPHEWCPVYCYSAANLKSHLQFHEKNIYKCPEPGCTSNMFSGRDAQNQLQTHMQIKHHKEMPLTQRPETFLRCTAQGCDALFIDMTEQKNHMSGNHKNDGPITCTIEGCNRKFHSKRALLSHTLEHPQRQPNKTRRPAIESCPQSVAPMLDPFDENFSRVFKPCPYPNCWSGSQRGAHGMKNHIKSAHMADSLVNKTQDGASKKLDDHSGSSENEYGLYEAHNNSLDLNGPYEAHDNLFDLNGLYEAHNNSLDLNGPYEAHNNSLDLNGLYEAHDNLFDLI